MPRTLIALFVLLFPAVAIAQEVEEGYTKLTGKMQIMSKNFNDPPEGEKKDRVGLYIDGPAAEQIYNAMPARGTRTLPCEDDSDLVRTAGGLDCIKYGNGHYYCTVAILLKNGRTDIASVC